MIDFGNIDISEAHLGNIELDSMWFGLIKVWPQGEPPVPPTPTVYTFTVSPTALTTDDSAKTVNFTVSTDSPEWNVEPSESWIIVNGITGNTVEVSIAANSGTSDRQGALVFEYVKTSTGSTDSYIVNVTQEGVVIINNIITYTSSNHDVITPVNTTGFGANIVSNIYYSGDDYGEITFDDSVTEIGEKAFSGRTILKTIVLPDDVSGIGKNSFAYCSGLTQVVMGPAVTIIGYTAFDRCSGLTSIELSDSVTILDDGCFRDCRTLPSITIPAAVTTIRGYAFSHCRMLTNITYKGTKSEWAAITKTSTWKNDIPATVVHCTDGDVAI